MHGLGAANLLQSRVSPTSHSQASSGETVDSDSLYHFFLLIRFFIIILVYWNSQQNRCLHGWFILWIWNNCTRPWRDQLYTWSLSKSNVDGTVYIPPSCIINAARRAKDRSTVVVTECLPLSSVVAGLWTAGALIHFSTAGALILFSLCHFFLLFDTFNHGWFLLWIWNREPVLYGF